MLAAARSHSCARSRAICIRRFISPQQALQAFVQYRTEARMTLALGSTLRMLVSRRSPLTGGRLPSSSSGFARMIERAVAAARWRNFLT
jgi:hypothetical protein